MEFPEPKDMIFPTEVKSDRIVLRQGKMNDKELVEETLKSVQEAQGEQERFSPFYKTDTFENILYFYNWHVDAWQKKCFFYLIYEKKTGEFLGHVGLHSFIRHNKTAEFAYWLKPGATGHGYCTEAIREMEKLAFQNGINQLIIKIDALNKKSMSVAQRAGYHLDEILRPNSTSVDLKVKNDKYVYTKLKSEWKKEQEKQVILQKTLDKHCVKTPCPRPSKGSR